MPLFFTSSNGVTMVRLCVGQASAMLAAPASDGGVTRGAGAVLAGGVTRGATGVLRATEPAGGSMRSTWPTSIWSGLGTHWLFQRTMSRQSRLLFRAMLRMVSPGCTW